MFYFVLNETHNSSQGLPSPAAGLRVFGFLQVFGVSSVFCESRPLPASTWAALLCVSVAFDPCVCSDC